MRGCCTFGLDRIYLQAKRYGADNAVTLEQIRAFLGALMREGDRGVVLTTSTFTPCRLTYRNRT